MKIRRRFERVALGVVLGGLSVASAAPAQTPATPRPAPARRAVSVPEVRHDAIPALRDIIPFIREEGVAPIEHPVRPIPIPRRSARAPLKRDVVLQSTATSAATLLLPIQGFEGVGEGLRYRITGAPSDINGAVGRTQFVQWANEAFVVFDKSGGPLYGPADGNTLWKGFSGPCEKQNDGDPIVQYDKLANRWLMTQFAVTGGPPYYECIAVSASDDATGGYARYAFKFSDFNDYPKFGVWPDAYYASFNMFGPRAFKGSKLCAFDRAAMLQGSAATMQCFDVRNEGGVLPADLDGLTPPPAGAAEPFVNFGVDRLNVWRFHVDWKHPASSRLTGPVVVPVSTFDPACGDGGACIGQPASAQRLDSLGDRLMYRLAYRQFGDHDAAVVNHSVRVDDRTGLRWYELRGLTTASPSVHQSGTYSPDGAHRWMGSAAMDKIGNLLVGFSASSDTLYPSIRVTGRAAADPANTLAAEFKVIDGKGDQQKIQRWGDYTSMSVDPIDDCSFWFTAQYLEKPGSFNWHTYVAQTKFGACR